ncbi:MAG: aminotransferase class I/II-fold pyridoxal phosphate-dependent enzyme [Gemmatimonadota bacterium]|nr:aminotransferase class I/II-fold pyridoxal phosphate-dependent enzyme [Gemmatimonadota bacterium]
MRRRIVIERAERLNQIPPYSTREINRYKKRLIARNIEPIDLTVGSIDSAVQQHTVARLTKSIKDIGSAGSAAAPVIPEFQKAFSSWFARRRDALVDGLKRLGWRFRAPEDGIYVWVPTPPRYMSVRFSVLLRKAGVSVVPGAFMGGYAEGYVRFALNTPEARLKTVIDRVEQSLSRRMRHLNTSQSGLV